jgi:hypothetical protein
MQCTYCGAKTEAGTSFTFYFGTHAKTRFVRKGGSSLTPAAARVVGSEQVFLCSACQIAARHRTFHKAALICGAVIVLSPAIIGLLLFPSLVPAWAELGAFLLSVPVVGIIVGVGSMVGLGALARSAIDAFGDAVLICCTWRKPYAVDGDDPNFDKTAPGEVFAMNVRRTHLKRQGYGVFFTRKAYSRLGRSEGVGRIAATVLVPVGLFLLGLFTLVCMGLGGLLMDWLH